MMLLMYRIYGTEAANAKRTERDVMFKILLPVSRAQEVAFRNSFRAKIGKSNYFISISPLLSGFLSYSYLSLTHYLAMTWPKRL